jgi:hypothetical protein
MRVLAYARGGDRICARSEIDSLLGRPSLPLYGRSGLEIRSKSDIGGRVP